MILELNDVRMYQYLIECLIDECERLYSITGCWNHQGEVFCKLINDDIEEYSDIRKYYTNLIFWIEKAGGCVRIENNHE